MVNCKKCPIREECEEFKREIPQEFKYSELISKELSDYCPLVETILDLIFRKAQALNDVFEVEKEFLGVNDDGKVS